VLYCDTDSVLVTDIGRERLTHLIDANSLGFLSEKGHYEDIEIFGCKDYVFGTKSRTKGVRGTALWLSRNTVEQTRWSGLRGLLAAGIVDRPSTSRVVKHLRRVYDKAVVQPSGECVPFLMGGDEILNLPGL
jgi:hypothetical protein